MLEISRILSSAVLGATKRIIQIPAFFAIFTISFASSGGRSGIINPSTPAFLQSLINLSVPYFIIGLI